MRTSRHLLLFLIALLVGTSAFAEIKRYDVPLQGSPSCGPENAPVTIVEFLDYQ
jgi:hypothetical protein